MATEIKPTRRIEELGTTFVPFEPGGRAPNRRAAVRFELQARVEFRWTDEKGFSRQEVGLTRDLSTKGAHIIGDLQPPKGARVAMNIEIPLSDSGPRILRVRAEATVVRVERAGSYGAENGFSVENERITSLGR